MSEKNDQSNAVLKERLAKYKVAKCELTKSNVQLQENLREIGSRATCMAQDLVKARQDIKGLKWQLEQATSPVVEEVKHNESLHTQTLSLDSVNVGIQTLNANPESPEIFKSRHLLSSCEDYIETDLGSSTLESECGNMSRTVDNGETEYLKSNIVELVKQKEELETELWKLKAELDSKVETLQECDLEKVSVHHFSIL